MARRHPLFFRVVAMLLLLAFCAGLCACSFGVQEPDGSGDDPDIPDNPDTPGGSGDGDPAPELLLPLMQDGEPCFQIVCERSLSSEVYSAVSARLNALEEAGVHIARVEDYIVDSISDCEVLIGGSVRYRDGCTTDVHDLGPNGYEVRVIGDRVRITGGSDAATIAAIGLFFDKYLGMENSPAPSEDVAVSRTLAYVGSLGDDVYPVCTVGGYSLDGYGILVHTGLVYARETALNLQTFLYDKVGKWLPIVDETDAVPGQKYLRLRYTEDAGEGGFRVFERDGELWFESEYSNAFAGGVQTFLDRNFPAEGGEVCIDADYSLQLDVRTVHYADFGATGNGATDDFAAILAAHQFANAGGQKVCAEEGATYYIGDHAYTVPVRTDVCWTGARFIIDDSVVGTDHRSYSIFSVQSTVKSEGLSVPEGYTLKAGQENIGFTFDGPRMVAIRNKNHRVYIRRGANTGSSEQYEIILVDAEGNVDPTTPIMWDYEEVTSLTATPLDEAPVLIEGGTFVTIANQAPSEYTYYNRNISIARSNTTVRGIRHEVTGEGDHGAPYNAFLAVGFSYGVVIENCEVTGHKVYRNSAGVSMGTYDLSSSSALNVSWRGCTQINSITNTTYWGIMGSNFCRNLLMEDCYLSRFDAHQGMWNATIRNSVIGQSINCIGGGTLLIENTTRPSGNSFLYLREDYGSTWNGDIILRNCTYSSGSRTAYLVYGTWASWDYGYTCYLPRSLTVDGLTVTKTGMKLYAFNAVASSSAHPVTDAKNPCVPTESVTIRGCNIALAGLTSGSNKELFGKTAYVVVTDASDKETL